MIELHIEPGLVMTWEEFQATKPPCSIALDGYVKQEVEQIINACLETQESM